MDEKKLFPAPLGTTRREFLKAAGLASTALALPTFIPASVLGRDGAVPPSERIRVGGIGLGNMGGGDFGTFLGRPEVQYLAVCDVRKNVRDGKKAQADERYKSKTASPTMISANCWPARISTRCTSPRRTIGTRSS